ncbi:hypothetical protein Scep_008272 [Stephania cephalantha]|uniref:Uncharacterized protein n=1 Tax=Stephania cephalantha TaxID=152367 RepID=A0AAP0PPH3_9MAGN
MSLRHPRITGNIPSAGPPSASPTITRTQPPPVADPKEVTVADVVAIVTLFLTSESAEEDLSPAKVDTGDQLATKGPVDLDSGIDYGVVERVGIQEMIKQWRFIPRVVKELARFEDMDRSKKSFHRKDLCRRAMICKHIYETEFNQAEDDSTTMKKKKKGHGEHGTSSKNIGAKASGYAYDSDETIEMTEDEIDLAYNVVASNISKR